MAKQRIRKSARKPLENQRRTRISFAEAMSSANRRAHEQANRRSGRREMKSVRAAIDAGTLEQDRLDRFQKLQLEERHNTEQMHEAHARSREFGKLVKRAMNDKAKRTQDW